MSKVIQRASVSLPANRPYWTDTGLEVKVGETLSIIGQGYVYYDRGAGYVSFVEGNYPADRTNTNHPENLGATGLYSQFAKYEHLYIVAGTAPLGVSMLILPTGTAPPPALPESVDAAVDNVWRLTRNFTLPSSLADGRIFLIYNDVYNHFGDNSGVFDIIITRSTDEPLDIDVGQPSPLRYCPPILKQAKEGTEFDCVWMLAIKPINGDWLGFTEFDRPLQGPEYADNLGNVTPAMTYSPIFADISNIPNSLKLSAQGTDVRLLAPQFLDGDYVPSGTFLDRVRLINGYFTGSYWELFQVNPFTSMLERQAWSCGETGNSQADDVIATAELTTYDELANRDVGDVFHNICQVGTRLGEKFGTGRCRNQVLFDGPDRDDWTVLATVETIGWNTLRLSYGTDAISTNALHAEFDEHLANGDIVMLDGVNAGYEGVIKSGELVSTGLVDIVLRRSLPQLPEVGDTINLTAGCRRNKESCLFYNNLSNMQASDLAGSADLLRRTRV